MRSLAGALALAGTVATIPALAQPRAIAAHGDWGAFRDGDRCYAVAMPTGRDSASPRQSFVTVGAAPSPRRVSVRLGGIVAKGSGITLTVGSRRFRLTGGGDSAWSERPEDDRAIVVAMRSAESLTISGRSIDGQRLRDRYRLSGAATAIDAATIACR